MIQYYDWHNYKLLISFTTYGQSSVYAVLADHSTLEAFLERVSEHHERPVAHFNAVLLSDDAFEDMLPYYEERGMVI